MSSVKKFYCICISSSISCVVVVLSKQQKYGRHYGIELFWNFPTGRSVIRSTATCHTSAISSNLWSCTQIIAHVPHVDRTWSCISWISVEMRFQPPDDSLRQTLTQINIYPWRWPGFSVCLIHTVWRQRVSVGDDIIARACENYKTSSVVGLTYWQNWKLFGRKTHSYNVWNVVVRDRRFSQRR